MTVDKESPLARSSLALLNALATRLQRISDLLGQNQDPEIRSNLRDAWEVYRLLKLSLKDRVDREAIDYAIRVTEKEVR